MLCVCVSTLACGKQIITLLLLLPSRTQINFTVAIDFTASNGEQHTHTQHFSLMLDQGYLNVSRWGIK